MKSLKKNIERMLVFVACFLVTTYSLAQQASPKIDSLTEARIASLEKQVALHKPGLSRLVVVGLTTFGYVSNKTETITGGVSQTNRFSSFGGNTYEFSPLFLWRQSNKVLLEFEPSFNNDGLSVNWANISYFALPNLIIHGGYFVLPFGIYNKKLAAGWINKVATDPIGLLTGADYGIGISGGMYLNNMKWNYDLSLTNGMALNPNGGLQNVNLKSASSNKTITGRLGLLPFSDGSLEIGISGMTGGVANGNAQFNNAKATFYAFDFNYVKNYDPLQINIKSQYNVADVSNQNYVNPSDSTNIYTFTNHSTSGYGQLSIRPIGSQSTFIKNLEFAFRYGNYTTPSNSTWGSKTKQIDYGINYWINWKTVIRVTYEILDSNSSVNPSLINVLDNTKVSAFHLQFSTQL